MHRPEQPVVHVVAGVLCAPDGRVLVSKRPAGDDMAGRWEFPGGKLEPGETVHDCLVRELDEELGIRVTDSQPLIRLTHVYPHRTVDLDVWRVSSWEGEPAPLYHEQLCWMLPTDLYSVDLLDADGPIITALRLPSLCLVTPEFQDEAQFLEDLVHSLAAMPAPPMVRLRTRGLNRDSVCRLAEQVVPICRAHDVPLLVNLAADMDVGLPGDGVHVSSVQAAALKQRPVARDKLFSVACHDASQVATARALDADLVFIGPVMSTPTHPAALGMGWPAFQALAQLAGVPAFAIGGLGSEELSIARAHDAHGVAAIRALWSGATPD